LALVQGRGQEVAELDAGVIRLFASVAEAMARATHALLNQDAELAEEVVTGDQEIDELTADLELEAWRQLTTETPDATTLRHLVGVLLILPELERSADLAEHIAQRASDNLGASMPPASRGVVQRMTEVAIEMWQAVTDSFHARTPVAARIAEDDEEMDILHERLVREIQDEDVAVPVATQVTLLARFYERFADHAVNLARRIELLPGPDGR
jgi:phosphate transport system protein